MTDTIFLRGESGALLTASLPLHFSLQDRLDKGELQQVNRDGTAWTGSPASEPEPAPDPAAATAGDDDPGVPKRTASQQEWAAYAIAQGMDPDEAHGMKRDDLYKAYRQGLRAVS